METRTHKELLDIIQSLETKVKDLEAFKKETLEVIRFYGDDNSWEDCWIDGCAGSENYFTSIKNDMGGRCGGYKAREFLAKLKAGEK